MNGQERLAEALVERYRIRGEIGHGGMATVYLAEDIKHERKVALKVFRPELASGLGSERFLREIKLTAGLNHSHILPLLDSGEADSILFYVMPYVEGESLRDKMKREGELGIEESLRITEQVANALAYAHPKGVVHRDIKPENILLQAGHVLVADFGIALAVDSFGSDRLTETGLSVGTPAYMSPEQVAGEKEIDHRSDLYSLGCVLYEMLAGDPPFTASHPRALLAKHLTDPAPPITTVRPGVPSPVAASINKALEKTPADRFDSASAFTAALSSKRESQEEKRAESIVVLPFANLSPDPENEYFSDGLTEDIITDLSKVGALRVISRTSAMQLKGSDKTAREIGHELGVSYVLEGSVRKAGDRLRVTAQLVDGGKDQHLWAERYDGTLEDIFDMQETVSRSIVEALDVRLNPEEHRRLGERPIDNAQANDCYLRARHAMEFFTEEGFQRALQHLQNGLKIIGENALLYAGLGYTHYNRANQGIEGPEEIDRAEEYGRKALALDPDCAEAHFVLGLVNQAFRGNQRQSLHHFGRSLAINPNDAHALVYTFFGHYAVGRPGASESMLDRVAQLDPLNPMIRFLPCLVHLGKGQFDQAADFPWDQLPETPNFVFIRLLSLTYARRFDEALAVIHDSVEDGWKDIFGSISRFIGAAIQRNAEKMEGLLPKELEERCRMDCGWSYWVGGMVALAGQDDAAFDWLATAVDRGFINYPLLVDHDPYFRLLRGQRRFQTLLERVKDEWDVFEL